MQMKEEVARGGGGGLAQRVRRLYEAYLAVKQRGTWEMREVAPGKRRFFSDRFADRLGNLFDSFHATAWWFGFWTLAKAFLSALVITNIFDPVVNAALITGLFASDMVVMTLFRPHADWSLFVLNTWTSLCNLASLVSVLAFLADTFPEALFSSVFFWLQSISILPLTVFGLLEPLAFVGKRIFVFLSCSCLSQPLPDLGAVGAGAGAIAVATAVGNGSCARLQGRGARAEGGRVRGEGRGLRGEGY